MAQTTRQQILTPLTIGLPKGAVAADTTSTASSPRHTAVGGTSSSSSESGPMSSSYEGMAGGRTSSGLGRSPFGLPQGDQNAASFLAHCYEQLMKDTSSMHSGLAALETAIDEPTIYVFIFTNPRSGNQQGRGLMRMALRNFRLRERPSVQVQIYDVTDEASRSEGLHYLHQLQLRQGDRLLRTAFPELFVQQAQAGACGVRPSPPASTGRAADGGGAAWEEWISDAAAHLECGLAQLGDAEVVERLERAQESAVKLHVWSAGGDGTVSATLQVMMDHGIDVGRVYFSCIPFGTGNDFADALGWGRSVAGDALGDGMHGLSRLVTERLDGYTCKLDIYEITVTTYDGGYVKHVEKNNQAAPGARRHTRLMIDYLSLGVQGFVGASFEMHRPGRRALNILMYTAAAAHWVLARAFPPITEALESVATVPAAMLADAALTDAERARWLEDAPEAERRRVLLASRAAPGSADAGLPVIGGRPIELDVQNVARFWGRNIDVWGRARGAGSGEWTPQYAGDGKVELFTVQSMADYTLNQLPHRDTYRVDRQAQMPAPVALHFRPPAEYPVRRRRARLLPWRRAPPPGLLNAMCDGEFVEIFRPRDVIVARKVTLKAVGRSPEASRIVLDTIKNDGLDAVHMDPTAAARGRLADPPAVASYVAAPFQRIFRRAPPVPPSLARDNTLASAEPASAQPPPPLAAATSSRSALLSFRESLLRTVRHRRSAASRDAPSLSDIRLESVATLPVAPSAVLTHRVHSKSIDLGRINPTISATAAAGPANPPANNSDTL
ncbi:hypothetical protein GGI19_002602 [Coemansia pectinata]|uniref:DAGKc domain-containing protein n=1 Tax=Coemansia pectinata TaxID=1052879 RepID=A0A9W8LA61_9FUNG|nr:hypothetical protein GGI19_002602 [Coemansia pectinata]